MKTKLLQALLFFFTFCIFAQEIDSPVKQYQTFRWKPITYAKRYEVIIEDKNSSEILKINTTECAIEVLLLPGKYRTTINAYNLINKKASSSPWYDFIVLPETEPYLAKKNIFKKEKDLYVLRRSQATSLLITGRNFFYENTTFSLVPAEKPESADDFPAYKTDRQEVFLPITSRNVEEDQLTVEIKWDSLFAGYYNLKVQNPSGSIDTMPVLVLPERAPVVLDDSFEHSKNYHSAYLSVKKDSPELKLTVVGTDFQYGTTFTFSPSEGIPYPFSSTKPRIEQIPTMISYAGNNPSGNTSTVTLSINPQTLETGYYSLTASTPELGSNSLNILVNVEQPQEEVPQVTKIKGKFNNSNKALQLSINSDKGAFKLSKDNYSTDVNVLLVSQCDTKGENNRIPLKLIDANKNGNKATFETMATNITAGTYALLIETPNTTSVAFTDITETFEANLLSPSEELVETKFMRPEVLAAPTQEQEVVSITENTTSISLAGGKWSYYSGLNNSKVFCPYLMNNWLIFDTTCTKTGLYKSVFSIDDTN